MQTQRQLTQTCKSVATANSGVEDKCVRKARKKIEATQVEELAFIGSTLSEMAIFLDCSAQTLYRRFHKVVKRGIVCRTILLRRQRFHLAMKGNAAALKWFRDASVDETNEQLKDLKFHEERASLTQEELNERILDNVKRQQEWLDKHPEIQELLLAKRGSLQTKTPQTRLSHGTIVEQPSPEEVS
jgi:DNA-binding Lrp family transcriptional regulator